MQRILAYIRTRFQRGRFAPYFIPIAMIVISLIAVVITLIALTFSVNQQIATGQNLLGTNLSDQTRTFVQLQRESLRMMLEIMKPLEEFDSNAAELQLQLLESRFNHMNRSDVQEILIESVIDNALELSIMWESLQPVLESWLAQPDDEILRANALGQLAEFERLANTTEIEFNRGRNFTLSEFSRFSQQVPVTFGIATVAILGLMIAIFYGVYRYVLEVQEAEAAKQTLELKDQFLAVMSHELRTPLNAIIGFLGLIRMGNNYSEEKIAHMIDRARSNAERLLTLINDILDLSKIEAGRFEIHKEAVNAYDLIQRWKSQTDILASQKGLSFNLTIDEKLPEELYLDADAVTKIITNLLSNAIKFTAEGSVNLNVYPSANQVIFVVRDTGIGIPEDKQALVFESFRQVDSSTRRAYGGTGLGLSIVKQLTQLLKGEIELSSQVQVGSTFTLRLPLEPVPANKLEKAGEQSSKKEGLENVYSQ